MQQCIEQMEKNWRMLKIPRPRCINYRGDVPASLRLWLGELGSKICDAAKQAIGWWSTGPVGKLRQEKNLKLCKMAFKVLDNHGYAAVDNDKDPGCTPARYEEFQKAVETVLGAPLYEAVGTLPPTLGTDHNFWINKNSKLEDDQNIRSELRMPMKVKGAKPESTLALTLKTQTGPRLLQEPPLQQGVWDGWGQHMASLQLVAAAGDASAAPLAVARGGRQET